MVGLQLSMMMAFCNKLSVRLSAEKGLEERQREGLSRKHWSAATSSAHEALRNPPAPPIPVIHTLIQSTRSVERQISIEQEEDVDSHNTA